MKQCLNKLLLFLAVLSATGCKSVPVEYNRHPLVEQILRFDPNYPGLLVNKVWRTKDGVANFDVLKYDLSDRELRLRLREMKFICNVNGKPYRIAQEQPGLIHESYKKSCFLFICQDPKLESVHVILKDDPILIDTATYCHSLEQYDFELP